MKEATECVKVEMKNNGIKNVENKDIEMNKIKSKMNEMKQKKIFGAKREGDFANQLKDMKKRHEDVYKISGYGKSVFLICGFDGSEHQNGVLRKINMLTLSTQLYPLFNKVLQQKGITTLLITVIYYWQ